MGIHDLSAFGDAFRLSGSRARADMDGDGDLDLDDLDALLLKQLGTVRGDINPRDGLFDGVVDVLDFAVLAKFFGLPGTQSYSGW